MESDVNETMSISIPYGAIKSWPRPQTIEVSIIISIPYGAIKSIYLTFWMVYFFLFQFLMVRLKENVDFIIDLFSKTFQFLMVRLKV